jgi:hypothetical protein
MSIFLRPWPSNGENSHLIPIDQTTITDTSTLADPVFPKDSGRDPGADTAVPSHYGSTCTTPDAFWVHFRPQRTTRTVMSAGTMFAATVSLTIANR